MRNGSLISLCVALTVVAGGAAAADGRMQQWEQVRRLQGERDALAAQANNARNLNVSLADENGNLRRVIRQKEQLVERVRAGEVAAAAEPIAPPPTRERVIWHNAFDKADAAFDLPHVSFPEMPDGKAALCVTSPGPDETKYYYATVALPIGQVEGKRIRCSALVKGEGVSTPPKHYMGVKFLLHVNTGDKADWPGLALGEGTFDWTSKSFTADIPAGAKGVRMLLGLQGVAGKVYFRDVKVERLE